MSHDNSVGQWGRIAAELRARRLRPDGYADYRNAQTAPDLTIAHWPGCWRVHPGCAVRRVERLEAMLCQLSDTLGLAVCTELAEQVPTEPAG